MIRTKKDIQANVMTGQQVEIGTTLMAIYRVPQIMATPEEQEKTP